MLDIENIGCDRISKDVVIKTSEIISAEKNPIG